MNLDDVMIRFRQLVPFQQAVAVGLLLFVIYAAYNYLFLKLNLAESVSTSIYSAILFMVVFYFTTVIIMKKNAEAMKQSGGPKKGLRK